MWDRSHIFANGQYITQLKNGRYAPAVMDPGSVLFSTLRRLAPGLLGGAFLAAREQKQNERLTIDVEAGSIYCVEWLVGDKMKLVEAQVGEEGIEGLKLAEQAESEYEPGILN